MNVQCAGRGTGGTDAIAGFDSVLSPEGLPGLELIRPSLVSEEKKDDLKTVTSIGRGLCV